MTTKDEERQQEILDRMVESPDTQGIRVFVYGTLKSGHCNNTALEKATFLGRCFVEGPHKMVDLGWYPGLVPSDDENKVYGEVYLVDEDTLYTLDCIEGHPHYYKRRKINTPWKNAWAYYLPSEYAEHSEVEDGVWEPNEDEREFVYGR